MDPAKINRGPCPRCGGALEFRHTVESHRTGAPVDFFRCKDCGYVHAVEHRTPALEAAAKRSKKKGYARHCHKWALIQSLVWIRTTALACAHEVAGAANLRAPFRYIARNINGATLQTF